jgi:type II secretory pathway component PulJ
MLLGLVIFAVIATGLYGVLAGALKLQKKMRSVHARCQDMRAAFDVIARDMENAVAYPFVKGRSDRLAFEGKGDKVAFFLPTDAGIVLVDYYAGDIDFAVRSETRVRRVKSIRESFEYEKGVNKRQYLVRRTLPLASVLAGKTDGTVTQALLAGLDTDGLKLEYGVVSKPVQGTREVKFQGEWKDNQLPDLIRVQVRFEGETPGSGQTIRRDIYPVVKGPVI